MLKRRIALVALALSALLVACKKDKGDSGEVSEYTARGIVVSISDSEISMNHEAMPTFKNRQGKVVGMAAMQMPFGVAKELDTKSFKVGDKVSFTFDVDFGRKGKPSQIKAVKVLPADTALTLADGSGGAHEGHGDHPEANGGKPAEGHEHPAGEHPAGEHPAGEHPSNGEHPAGEHPAADGDKPAEGEAPAPAGADAGAAAGE